MLSRPFAVALALAMVITCSLALAAPVRAGSLTTVTTINESGKAATGFDATFLNTGGTVADITVLFSSGIATTTKAIDGGTGVEIGFASPLPYLTGVLTFTFETTNPVTLSSAVWLSNVGSPISASDRFCGRRVDSELGNVQRPCGS